jgi:hypothetical protein
MEPALAIFATLLGHCWQAQLTPSDVDTHCFTDMWKGGHVRDRHVVSHGGKPVYEGETIYSFDGKAIAFTYVNSMGGVGGGTARIEDKAIAFSGSMRARPGSAPQPMDSSWRLLGDGYEVVNKSGTAPVRFRAAR